MTPLRVAVVGAGAFGRNHLRVLHELSEAVLAAVVDADEERRTAASTQYGCPAFASIESLTGLVDAAVIAAPTVAHHDLGCRLLAAGIDVLIEKPLAVTLAEADDLITVARQHGRILQVGHLERFNPAVTALQQAVTVPLFFEIHRLNLFSPRSLDVDVVLDLMIHDIDIVLALTQALPEEIRAAGISILSPKVDIANVRLAFPGGVVANLTASRVSTERVRKLRLFQPGQYLSLDYERKDVLACGVSPERQVSFAPLPVEKEEPLRREWQHFLHCVRTRATPLVTGEQGRRALEVALQILDRIDTHAQVVAATVQGAQERGKLAGWVGSPLLGKELV